MLKGLEQPLLMGWEEQRRELIPNRRDHWSGIDPRLRAPPFGWRHDKVYRQIAGSPGPQEVVPWAMPT